MENKKHSVSIGERLYKEIKDYCELNSLKLNEFVEGLLKKSFTIEKYGEAPFVVAGANKEHSVVFEKSEKEREFEEAFEEIVEKITKESLPEPKPEEIKEKTEEILKEEPKEEEVKVEQKPKRKVTKLK